MKKILSLIATLAVGAPAITSVVACKNEDNSKITYSSVTDAIKAVNVNSYHKTGNVDLDMLANSILGDAVLLLMQNKFKAGVVFNPLALKLNKDDILIGTRKINSDDLNVNKILQLNVSFTYASNTTKIKANSSILNVITKTPQQVVDYINHFDFTNLNKIGAVEKGISVDDLKNAFSFGIKNELGSFGYSFINNTDITINKIFKGKTTIELVDADLATLSNLNITVVYKYNLITDEQKINFTVPIKILVHDGPKGINFDQQTIKLPAGSSHDKLIAADVTEITNAITTEVQKQLIVKFPDITTTDYFVTGIDDTIKVGANLSKPATDVIFSILVKPSSTNYFGFILNQTIQVTITNSTS